MKVIYKFTDKEKQFILLFRKMGNKHIYSGESYGFYVDYRMQFFEFYNAGLLAIDNTTQGSYMAYTLTLAGFNAFKDIK